MYEIVSKDVLIEELVEKYPKSVSFLMQKGVKCIACGEPVWGTLEAAALEIGFSIDEISYIVKELNVVLQKEQT